MMTHKRISFVKSGVRIFGYLIVVMSYPRTYLAGAFVFLIFSEVVGILEELGEK